MDDLKPTIQQPSLKKAVGGDTCAKINATIAFSGIVITIVLPGIGEMKVLSVKPANEHDYILVHVVDAMRQEFTYAVPWYTCFRLYMGER